MTYTPAFQHAVALILAHEGGYSNDPEDPGGETAFGISKKAFPNEDIKALTREKATAIYHRHYWLPVKGDQLPPALAIVTFDAAVNCGVLRAVQWLQQSLNVTADGVIGPTTLAAAVRHRDPLFAAAAACRRRVLYYTQLRPFARFGAGWIQRTFATYRVAVEGSALRAA